MHEVFPLMAGLAVGLMVQRLVAPRLRIAALLVLCAVFGAIASFISGELFVSWTYLLFDIVQVWIGAAVVIALFAWRRRAER